MRKFRQVIDLVNRPHWLEILYAACCYYSARCKWQWMAGNFPELARLRADKCLHLHDKDEWSPFFDDKEGRWMYPSKDEAEYTASLTFSIAVCFTAAAARKGKFKLAVPRMPQKDATGSRVNWN